MIGQTNLIKLLQNQLETNSLASFIIISGAKGSGKKTLVHQLFPKCVEVEFKVDALRGMISLANSIHDCVFLIADADNMSMSAQNALLKVVEECKNNNRFIITVEDEYSMFPTIRSRATVFKMDLYTPDEIYKYANERLKYILHDDEWDVIKNICQTPGDVICLGKYPLQFYEYVQLVQANIAEVSGANAFKIADKIAFKDEDTDKYDLRLFLYAFRKLCFEKMKQIAKGTTEQYTSANYMDAITITTKYLAQIRIRGINKQSLFDAWLLDIRKAWMQ